MDKISYSQNNEDVFLYRCFGKQKNGFYIDIGCHHPIKDSVSYLFYEKGWSGINLDINNEMINLNNKLRQRDKNLNLAAYNEDNIELEFYISKSTANTSLFKLSDDQNINNQKSIVKSITMDTLIKKYFKSNAIIDFVKLDVEGSEEIIFDGWNNLNVKIILFEKNNLNHEQLKKIHNKIEGEFLKVYDDGINFFYLNKKFSDLKENFSKPVSYHLDGFIPYIFQNEIVKKEDAINTLNSDISAKNYLISELVDKTVEKKIPLIIKQEKIKNILIKIYYFVSKIKFLRKIMNLILKIIFPEKKFYYFDFNEVQKDKTIKSKKIHHKDINEKNLIIDFSSIVRIDQQTGIQRVAKKITLNLLQAHRSNVFVDNIFLVFKDIFENNFKKLRYKNDEIIKFINSNKPFSSCIDLNKSEKYNFNKKDIFLGLDYSVDTTLALEKNLLNWKNNGTKIIFFLYDLLPIKNATWFSRKIQNNTKLWLKTISQFDGVVCISKNTRDEYLRFLDKEKINITFNHITEFISMGSDFDNLIDQNIESEDLLERQKKNFFNEKITFLIVGTLEPRKGHLQMIKIFKELIKEDKNIYLKIVGKYGWNNESIIQSIISTGQNIDYVGKVNDEDLHKLYKNSDVIIMPSFDEGFGLPLVEALKFNKHVISRNIPIFREVMQEQGYYFPNSDEGEITKFFRNWIKKYRIGKINKEKIIFHSWFDSCKDLLRKLKRNNIID